MNVLFQLLGGLVPASEWQDGAQGAANGSAAQGNAPAGAAGGGSGAESGGAGGGLSPFVNADGTFAENWHAGLGDEYAGLAKFKCVQDLAKSYRHLEGRQQGSSEGLLAAEIPDSAEGYGLQAPEELPEGVVWDDEAAKRYAEIAREHRVPKEAMQALAAEMLEIQSGHAARMQELQGEYLAKAEQRLKDTWGSDYDAKLGAARNTHHSLLSSMGIDPADEEAAQLAASPVYVRILSEVSRYMRQDTRAASTRSGDYLSGGRERANDIITNPQNPHYESYWNNDPSTRTIVKRLLGQ